MNISLTSIKKLILALLHRFHAIIFVVVVVGGLAAVVLLLNSIIVSSSEQGDYVPPGSNPSSFDQTTIDRIEQLKTRTDSTAPLDLSKGRTNPFVE
ncbi:MAG TPA: hypothetical protein VK497_02425 [Candidatus Saccharimonadales bacterium]|nr:hypothetical protein [Candidatus Saccharimonadales bacterium]